MPSSKQNRCRRSSFRFFQQKDILRRLFWLYLSVLTFFAIVGDRGLWRSYLLWSETKRLDQDIVALKGDIHSLRKGIKKLRHDPRTIERYAREELFLAGENEIHYIFR